MAVILCQGCARVVAPTAEQCSHCGLQKPSPRKETLMFKLTPFISLMGFIGLLVMMFW